MFFCVVVLPLFYSKGQMACKWLLTCCFCDTIKGRQAPTQKAKGVCTYDVFLFVPPFVRLLVGWLTGWVVGVALLAFVCSASPPRRHQRPLGEVSVTAARTCEVRRVWSRTHAHTRNRRARQGSGSAHTRVMLLCKHKCWARPHYRAVRVCVDVHIRDPVS